MQTLPYSNEQLQSTVRGLEILATISPQPETFLSTCKQLGWSPNYADSLAEFDTPCNSPFFVYLYEDDSIGGGCIALCLLEWDEYEAVTVEAQQSKEAFNAKYFETVSVAKQQLGEADSVITEARSCQQCAIWRRKNAFIFVLQGADDYEGIDIRLWLEYYNGNDILPESQVFEWLCQRHLSKTERVVD